HLTDRFSELLAPEISRQMFDPEAQVEQSQATEAAAAADEDAGDAGTRAGQGVFRLLKPGEDGYVEPEAPEEPAAPAVPDPGYADPGYIDPGYAGPGYIDPGWSAAY
ncbi:MAG: hypothetical protein L0G90_10990, partial [Corynebacterium glyciniphilum]|nr:hypothetical protein [Corynebacterium glyciniphilum]